MQNWKIKRMSHKRLGEFLKGIATLIENYEKKTRVKNCPFCVIVGCSECLWEIIEGEDCFWFKYKLGIKQDITIARNSKKWREARIPMLRRWKKILQAEKDSRADVGA